MSSVSAVNSLLSSTASSSTTSGINLSSILQTATGASSSGIDVSAAVAAAIYADRASERQWQAQQSTISSQVTALTSIQTALTSVTKDLTDLGSLSGSLSSRTVSSSSGAVSATASTGAATGRHTVAVQNLAATASWYSPALAGGSTELGAGTITITNASGTQTAITTGAGIDSLTDLASAINSSSAGVDASVVIDANGSRLALVGAGSGAASDFSVSYGVTDAASWSSASLASGAAGLTAGNFQVGDGSSTATISVNAGDTLGSVAASINSASLNVTASVVSDSSGTDLQIVPQSGSTVSVTSDPAFTFQRASMGANALLTVDGIPISSASNTVTSVLPGITLNLTGTTASGSPASLQVAPDTSTITQALSNFVTDYNAALSQVNQQFTFSASTSSQGALGADSNIRNLQSVLLQSTGYTASAGSGRSSIKSLSDLGISVADDGSLSLDSSKLSSALADPSAVQEFFQGNALNGFAQSFSTDVTTYSDPSTGSIAKEISSLNAQYTAFGTEVTGYESGYIANQTTLLTAMYSKAEIALQQLPQKMQEINAELGNNSSSNSGS